MEFNVFAAVILLALIVDYALNLLSDHLNLRAAGEELPREFEGVYEQEQYRDSQRYLHATTRFGQLMATVNLIVLLSFWFLGGFAWLDGLVAGVLPEGWLDSMAVRGLLYVGCLLILKFVLSLPFRVYRTFVIEERFGFNQTTARTFVLDMVKGIILSVVLGAPLFVTILEFFQRTGSMAWVYCWAVSAVFMLFVQFIAPRWIMPLFNEFEPLAEGELRGAIEDYVEKVDFPIEGVYEMDGSRRSSRSNAFMAGFGGNRKIALFDTLIDRHDEDELVAVLAHEVAHYKKKHVLKSVALAVLELGVMFYLLSIFLESEGLYRAFGFAAGRTPLYAGFVLFGLLYSPVKMVLSVLYNAFSRRNEFEADRFAAETTGRPDKLAEALKKLSRDNLGNLTPHPLAVFLHYSHPPVLERVRQLQRSKGVVERDG
ncbi:MAG: M48 family metallopeptidase [Planctomycetota bacterium]